MSSKKGRTSIKIKKINFNVYPSEVSGNREDQVNTEGSFEGMPDSLKSLLQKMWGIKPENSAVIRGRDSKAEKDFHNQEILEFIHGVVHGGIDNYEDCYTLVASAVCKKVVDFPELIKLTIEGKGLNTKKALDFLCNYTRLPMPEMDFEAIIAKRKETRKPEEEVDKHAS